MLYIYVYSTLYTRCRFTVFVCSKEAADSSTRVDDMLLVTYRNSMFIALTSVELSFLAVTIKPLKCDMMIL